MDDKKLIKTLQRIVAFIPFGLVLLYFTVEPERHGTQENVAFWIIVVFTQIIGFYCLYRSFKPARKSKRR